VSAPTNVQLNDHERAAYESNVGKFYIYRFVQNFQFWWPIWVIYLTDLRGLSFTEVALLEAPFFLSMVTVQIPVGVLADRIGRKPVMMMGAALSALAVLAFGLADSFVLILLAYVLWAWSLATVNAADNAFLYDTLRQVGQEERFQRVLGVSTALFNAAIVCGLLTGGLVAEEIGLAATVQLSAIAPLLSLAVILAMREPRFRSERASPGVAAFVREAYRIGSADRAVPALILLYGLLGMGAVGVGLFFQPFLDGHGVEVSNLGYIQAPARVFGAIGALGAFWFAARTGKLGSLYWITVCVAGSYVVLGLWDSVAASIMFPLISLATAAAIPLTIDMINRRIPSEQRATILSGGQLVFALLTAGFAPMLGAVADAYSLQAGFLVGGLVIAGAAFTTLGALQNSVRRPAAAMAVEAVAGSGQPMSSRS
jgi:predicted MFS family arabinose efflux permease